MKYRYLGPVPVADDTGELVHPLDVREFAEPPDCPPWEPAEQPDPEPAPGAKAESPAPAKAPAAAAKPEGK